MSVTVTTRTVLIFEIKVKGRSLEKFANCSLTLSGYFPDKTF